MLSETAQTHRQQVNTQTGPVRALQIMLLIHKSNDPRVGKCWEIYAASPHILYIDVILLGDQRVVGVCSQRETEGKASSSDWTAGEVGRKGDISGCHLE